MPKNLCKEIFSSTKASLPPIGRARSVRGSACKKPPVSLVRLWETDGPAANGGVGAPEPWKAG